MGKTCVHQLIGEDHRVFQTDVSIAGVDQRRDGALVHRLIDQRKRQAIRNDIEQKGAANCGVHKRSCGL